MLCDEKFMWISTKSRKKINDQTENENEANHMTIISWSAYEIMMKQRRFKLTIVLKIVDRKNEIFIVDNTANEKINLITVDDETNEVTEEKKEKVA